MGIKVTKREYLTIKQLNEFVNIFANEINKIHLEGFGLDGEDGRAFLRQVG